MVVWLTGLSGAGKTTLATALVGKLKQNRRNVILLDGDGVRACFGDDLGHAEADRRKQIMRVQRLARFLSEQEMLVVVAVVYSNPEQLAWNREKIRGYLECYLRVSLKTVKDRDAKGLYAKAEKAETANTVGIDIPWHEPVAPDLVFDLDNPVSPEQMADYIIERIPVAPAK